VTCKFTLGFGAEQCDSALTISRRGRKVRLRPAPVACRVPVTTAPTPATPTTTPAPGPAQTVPVMPPPLDLGGVVPVGAIVGAPPGV
jgi:hypothetical protein